MVRRLVLGVVMAAATPALAGPCAVEPFGPVPISNGGVAIAEGGGVIVAQDLGGGRGKDERVEQPGWRIKDVNDLKKPMIKTIAPGLAVYQLPAGGGATLTLVDDAQQAVFEIRRALAPRDLLPAPKVSKVEYKATTTKRGPASMTSTTVRATFEAAPTNTVALVLYEVDGATPIARTWSRVTDGAKESYVYVSGGRCRPGIPGQQPSAKGTKVQLAWLDSSGRLSPPSKTITVK